ncbi:monothiol glutaredoxin-like protein [Elsinoe australis]|uniref:Monothiol glutaredoxin-like protein n=1 Tax=Elsinoe australis TaxID=40998 RepID=A0A4U7AYR2_9PEZI|nr:monothiol glutaredoxin-like protein [Elsinoe australis]
MASGSTVTDIPSESAFVDTTSALPPNTLQVIYFHAPWAEPCKQMSAVISTLASTYPATTPPNIFFLSLDAEEVSEISERYNVTQVPYIVLQKGNDILEAIAGGDAAKVRTTIEKYAGAGSSSSGTSLPPLQKVTKPAASAQDLSAPTTNGTKNLSTYAPSGSDPNTAPEYSSGEDPAKAKEALNARLSELVKAAPVMLFMKGTPSAPQCGFSRQTVSMLRERGIRYGFFNILADDDVRQGLKEYSEWPTFPQVYVGGELIGGLDILKEEFENDPDFLEEYTVSRQRNAGGPAAPDQQAAPA